jgi:hypothetical protein
MPCIVIGERPGMGNSHLQEYMSKVLDNLSVKGFKIKKDVNYNNQEFFCTAKKFTFETGRFGFINVTFVFSKLSIPEFNQLKKISTESYKYAKKTSGIHPLPGFGYGLLCIPVVIVDSLDSNTIVAIQQKSLPIHWGASFKLAVFCLNNQKLYYCETSPELGLLYHDLDREIIREMLLVK